MNILENIEVLLKDVDIQIIRKDDYGSDTIFILNDDLQNKIKYPLAINIIKQKDENHSLSYVQFYFHKKTKSNNNLNSLQKKILQKNRELIYGNLNISNNKIYYKYVLICKENKVEDIILYEILNSIFFIMDRII